MGRGFVPNQNRRCPLLKLAAQHPSDKKAAAATLDILLKYGVDIHVYRASNVSHLAYFADRDDVEEVRLFLERGADPLLESRPSPLYAYVKSGSFGAVSLPLKAIDDR